MIKHPREEGGRGARAPQLDCIDSFSYVLFFKRVMAYFSLFHSKLLQSMAWCNYGSMNDWWGFFPPPLLPPSMQFPVK